MSNKLESADSVLIGSSLAILLILTIVINQLDQIIELLEDIGDK